tara:strand:+ start:1 stop:1638 length:1638 start_codon:yes stop_codon:yes gene_type:complete
MLLWLLVLAIFNYLLFKQYNKKNFILISKSLEVQALIIIGFLLFTILTSNPFEKVELVKDDGLGFNPILQDPALAIHPPLLYIGYVGYSAVFSLSVAALSLNEKENFNWYNYMRPFALISWSFLTIGIGFGSLWAYYELGWGGWWFWDPVENASLMPWLIGTALVHSIIVLQKKRSLQSWVLFLAILAFLLSIIGTFLVRSGILTSVHTFALDPTRGIYILSFIFLLGLYSLGIYFTKSKNFVDKKFFSFFSREGTILVNNVLMVIVCASVFLGTIYPLLIEALFKNKISVGEPYFNSTVIPLMIPAFFIMGIGPMMSWEKDNFKKIYKKINLNILMTLGTTVIFFCSYKKYTFFGIAGIFLAAWIIINSLDILYKKLKLNKNIKNLSLSMILSHIGVGLIIIGITGSSIWQEEKIIKMKINEETIISNYKISFKEINEITGKNYLAIQGKFLVKDLNKNFVTELKPENRYYPISKNFTTEADIHTNILRDLYLVIGEGDLKNGWIVRIYHNPLVIWIWIGVFIIFIGGIISVKKNYLILKGTSI